MSILSITFHTKNNLEEWENYIDETGFNDRKSDGC
jgi:hypothetical protein